MAIKMKKQKKSNKIGLGADISALGLPGYVENVTREKLGEDNPNGDTRICTVRHCMEALEVSAQGRDYADLGLVGLGEKPSDILELALGASNVEKTAWVKKNLGKSWGANPAIAENEEESEVADPTPASSNRRRGVSFSLRQ